jgi:hypothetical protein
LSHYPTCAIARFGYFLLELTKIWLVVVLKKLTLKLFKMGKKKIIFEQVQDLVIYKIKEITVDKYQIKKFLKSVFKKEKELGNKPPKIGKFFNGGYENETFEGTRYDFLVHIKKVVLGKSKKSVGESHVYNIAISKNVVVHTYPEALAITREVALHYKFKKCDPNDKVVVYFNEGDGNRASCIYIFRDKNKRLQLYSGGGFSNSDKVKEGFKICFG